MNTSCQHFVFFEQSNGLNAIKVGCTLTFIREELIKPRWHEYYQWVDIGHIANAMVKQGIAADHADALKLLNSFHVDGNG